MGTHPDAEGMIAMRRLRRHAPHLTAGGRHLGRWLAGLAAACLAVAVSAQPAWRPMPNPTPWEDALRIDVLQGTLHDVARRGSIRLAYRTDIVPFSFVPQGRQRPVGYSIDICQAIVKAVARRLDRNLLIDWIPVTAGDRFDAIAEHRADLECGTSSDTPQRRQQVSFSPPIFITGARLLVARDSKVRSLAQLSEQRIGVVSGTTAQAALTHWQAQRQAPAARFMRYATYPEAYAALTQGAIDALLADDVLLHSLLSHAPDRNRLRVLDGPRITHEIYGIAYRHDDAQMQAIVSDTLSQLAASRELDRIHTRWFLRRLPTGPALNLPADPALQSTLRLLKPASTGN